jgi:SAM-dependent methyltransferase
MTDYVYPGGELALFAYARNWKRYYAGMIRPFLGDEVLEVGAGLGATGQAVCRRHHHKWVCLEPDDQMCRQLEERIGQRRLPGFFRSAKGTLAALLPGDLFDTVLYVDVLEHIEQDREETRRAAAHLKPGGFLIILAPAHPFLFSPFDQAIGHYRRYTLATLAAAVPPELDCRLLRYVDSVGFLASLGNRFVLRKPMPNLHQVLVWDRVMIPASRVLDRLIQYRVGKSVLGVWRKP